MEPRRGLVCEQRAAWVRRRRKTASPGRIAFKTGTSYGYRDAWSVGFDGRHTIGVWVGRPDGAPVPGLDRPRGGGADPVRRLCPHRHRRLPCRAASGRRAGRFECQTAAAAAALPAGPARRRHAQAAAAHYFPAGRRQARSLDDRRQARSGGAQSHRRGRAADRAGQRRAGRRSQDRRSLFFDPPGPDFRGSR